MVQDPKCEGAPAEATEETLVDVEKEIQESMGAGKKHLLCSDYPEAVACFQEASSLLAEKHGEMAQECGDAYYYYGVSLLELARLENGVLGNALKGVPDDDEDSDKESEVQFEKPNLAEGEREKLREEVEAAMATEEEEDDEGDEGEKKEEAEEKEGEKTEEMETKSAETLPEQKVEKSEVAEAPSASMDSEQPSTSKSSVEQVLASTSKSEPEKEGEEEDPDDISNMQLAWEMLELAKVLYSKREKNKANSLLVAQCHLKLGESGLEVENYPQAIGDFLECLAIQKEHLDVTDRKLAESHYNLGLAYSFDKLHESALEHYREALDVLEGRVELLEERIANGEGNAEKSRDVLEECREVGEIKQLIPDINSKIEDVLATKNSFPRTLEVSPFRQTSAATTTGFGSSSSSPSCSTIPVRKVTPSSVKESSSDISHLVRRKRASPDDDGSSPKADVDAKKAKQEPDHNKENEADGGSAGDNCLEKNGSQEKTDADENSASEPKKKMATAGDAPVLMET